MREIKWADTTSNDQYAYNVVPKPSIVTTPTIKYIDWTINNNIIFIFGYNANDELIFTNQMPFKTSDTI